MSEANWRIGHLNRIDSPWGMLAALLKNQKI